MRKATFQRYLLVAGFCVVSTLLGLAEGCTKASESSPSVAAGAAPVIQISYFHRTVRCPSCIKMESLAKQAVEETFGGELAAGRMVWHSLNLDTAENKHFEKDYALKTQSVVVSEVRGGKDIRWKNLEKVWELLEDDPAFIKYVQDEVRSFSETSSGT